MILRHSRCSQLPLNRTEYAGVWQEMLQGPPVRMDLASLECTRRFVVSEH
jgi:hypothetical protein